MFAYAALSYTDLSIAGKISTFLPVGSGVSESSYLRFGLMPVSGFESHPLLAGVRTLDGGGRSFHYTVRFSALSTAAELVATWSDVGRTPLVAANSRVVCLNFHPVSSTAGGPDFWNASTDGARLMANALLYNPGGPGQSFCSYGLVANRIALQPRQFWQRPPPPPPPPRLRQ